MIANDYKWWQKTVVYQIYPRSYRDSTGNGIGDLNGIREKVDYLADLGIETVWFNPFFKSPQKDHGYDVSDYREIDPVYGTMHDFEALLKDLHDRNIKLILDLVLNHTSDEHPWFIESASSRDNPKRDWYIWRDGKKPSGRKPPNNWIAILGGKAWKYDQGTDQWYYFHFLPFQPDLNYRNPEVKEEMFNVMRFWLKKGVDGFRLDILHSIYEDEALRDDKFSWHLLPSEKRVSSLFHEHLYDLNLPETFDFSMELRKIMDEFDPPRFLVGEVAGSVEELRKYYGPNNNGLNLCFLFEFMGTKFNSKSFYNVISRIEKSLPYPFTPTYVLGNHDQVRSISRINNDVNKAKLVATMQLTLRGVPFLYYGEELGMENVYFDLEESQDPLGKVFSKWPIPILAKLLGLTLIRDGCRTPMQWNNTMHAGFSSNPNCTPWLRVPESYLQVNVEQEENDPNSILNCYKQLLKIRQEYIALQQGKLEFINKPQRSKDILGYSRTYKGEIVYTCLNFSSKELRLKLPIERPTLLFSTSRFRDDIHSEINQKAVQLSPIEGIVFK